MTEPVRLLPGGGLRVEWGPVSLAAAARWGGESREEVLRAAGREALDVLGELAAHRRLLAVEVSRIRNPAALPGVVRAAVAAARLFPGVFVTPLAAVAGTVADHVADFLAREGATWAVVNNGGDVAVRLAPGEGARVGVMPRIGAERPAARFRLEAEDGVGGVTTSGRGGRSLTLGVADAVTALAGRAAVADVAATLIANAVDVDSAAVERVRAEEVDPETDLRGLWVTGTVGSLAAGEVREALDRGEAAARRAVEAGLIRGAMLSLSGFWRFVGWPGPDGVDWLNR